MYSSELPARPIKQVTKMRDGPFLSIKQTQHLLSACVRAKKIKCPRYHHSLSFIFVCFSYQNISRVDFRVRMTTEQRLWGSGELRARDLSCGRFLADGRHDQLDDDQMCL